MAAKKTKAKDDTSNPTKMRALIAQAIMDGEGGADAEETAEAALKAYLDERTDAQIKRMYEDIIERPKKIMIVVVAALRKCANDKAFLSDLGVKTDFLREIAGDIEDGDLVIEEACEDDLATLADRGFDSRGWRWDTVSLKEKTT